jgi:hypothetical protein
MEAAMHLKFETFDGRRRCDRDIIDEDTAKSVGYIRSNGVGFSNYGGIDITLFDGKYVRTVNTYQECYGFVQGVQAVLNHMTAFTDYSANTQESAA